MFDIPSFHIATIKRKETCLNCWVKIYYMTSVNYPLTVSPAFITNVYIGVGEFGCQNITSREKKPPIPAQMVKKAMIWSVCRQMSIC